jgi:hypothetical protein
VNSSAKYSLTVTCEEWSPADLPTFLRAIPHVKVVEALPKQGILSPLEISVFPEGEFEEDELFRIIERQVENWFRWRTDAVTVEIHKPDGHLQVLVRQKD